MHKKKQKEKLIGNNDFKKKCLDFEPNKAYGNFILESSISDYQSLSHELEYIHENIDEYDSYYFNDFKLSLLVDVNGIIKTIETSEECYWNGINLIGMYYEHFLSLASKVPDEEDCLYVLLSEKRGQNQKVYTFNDLGLMIWVWRRKIITVQISNFA